jgi:MHS family proline/betaine transporter-like MFS transporter
MFLAAAAGYVLLSYPLFRMMTAGTFGRAVLGGLVFAVCNSLFSGCMAAAMVELFPTRTRYTGVAIGYNAGQTLLGGTAPLVGTALIQWTGNDLAPAFYLIACATIAGVSCPFIKARHGQPLDEAMWLNSAPPLVICYGLRRPLVAFASSVAFVSVTG